MVAKILDKQPSASALPASLRSESSSPAVAIISGCQEGSEIEVALEKEAVSASAGAPSDASNSHLPNRFSRLFTYGLERGLVSVNSVRI